MLRIRIRTHLPVFSKFSDEQQLSTPLPRTLPTEECSTFPESFSDSGPANLQKLDEHDLGQDRQGRIQPTHVCRPESLGRGLERAVFSELGRRKSVVFLGFLERERQRQE